MFVGSAARHRASLGITHLRRFRVTSLLLSIGSSASVRVRARFSRACIEKYTRDRRYRDHKSRTISMLMRDEIGNRPIRSRVDPPPSSYPRVHISSSRLLSSERFAPYPSIAKVKAVNIFLPLLATVNFFQI